MEKKRHVLSSESSERIFGKHSGFRNLRAYRLAELCYDFTTRFARADFGVRRRPEAKGRKRLACRRKDGNDERNGNFSQ